LDGLAELKNFVSSATIIFVFCEFGIFKYKYKERSKHYLKKFVLFINKEIFQKKIRRKK